MTPWIFQSHFPCFLWMCLCHCDDIYIILKHMDRSFYWHRLLNFCYASEEIIMQNVQGLTPWKYSCSKSSLLPCLHWDPGNEVGLAPWLTAEKYSYSQVTLTWQDVDSWIIFRTELRDLVIQNVFHRFSSVSLPP